jgi:hypothetical protein
MANKYEKLRFNEKPSVGGYTETPSDGNVPSDTNDMKKRVFFRKLGYRGQFFSVSEKLLSLSLILSLTQ